MWLGAGPGAANPSTVSSIKRAGRRKVSACNRLASAIQRCGAPSVRRADNVGRHSPRTVVTRVGRGRSGHCRSGRRGQERGAGIDVGCRSAEAALRVPIRQFRIAPAANARAEREQGAQRRPGAAVPNKSAVLERSHRAFEKGPRRCRPALTLNLGSRGSPSRNRQALPLGNAHRFTDGLEATLP